MKSKYRDVYPKNESELIEKIREAVAEYGNAGSGFGAELGAILGGGKMSDEQGEVYEKGAHLMRDLAVIAFNYGVHLCGASGYQGSIAAMEAYGTLVGIENFGIMQMDDLLYPQHDLRAKLEQWITEATPRIQEEARKRLAENSMAVDTVRAHWKYLAEGGRP